MVIAIGITGGIGAGKSVVSRICRLKGHEVYDCDFEAKRIMENSAELKDVLVRRLGKDVLSAEGNIDRRFLADKVFTDDRFREWLNSRVHAMVRDDIRMRILSFEKEDGGEDGGMNGNIPFFIESAILSTSGLEAMCDRIWLVECDDEVRFERAMSRGGIDRNNLLLRMEAQKTEFDSLPSAKTDVVLNDGSESLLKRIDALLEVARIYKYKN